MIRLFKILIASVFLTSCSSIKKPAPIVDLRQPPTRDITTHTVAKGETLYSIAWRYGLDYRILARANNIGADFRIVPGQILFLRSDHRAVSVTPTVATKPQPKVTSPPPTPVSSVKKTSVSRSKPLTTTKTTSENDSHTSDSIRWSWPSPGPLVSGYVPGNPAAEGIDIGVKKGESVTAAADGVVVYAGEGLRGYGKLLIIKHNRQFLSAYAHADEILVEEGHRVQAGQKVAEIGSSGTEKTKLYFEIRKDGKPVDPMRYLPKR
ncbi:peptidoglycan DD-metalloendopeptidase family protein [Halioxenophilus sp. WMMB6]|uniref:peptidoglycan DD-metalloendopeptidase family protein n=1 Tax=Halioxenophilus sp. WMMB6 TaxID=3073815 RepID=UPI00295E69BE|nr:peptidoglycan DD-metalloendopeptidase family protein [Halioxenophilus sp. WMMB6]